MERISANEVDDITEPLALDLIAAFSLMEEDTYKILDKAGQEGWDTDRIISEIESMLSTSSAPDAEKNASNQTSSL